MKRGEDSPLCCLWLFFCTYKGGACQRDQDFMSTESTGSLAKNWKGLGMRCDSCVTSFLIGFLWVCRTSAGEGSFGMVYELKDRNINLTLNAACWLCSVSMHIYTCIIHIPSTSFLLFLNFLSSSCLFTLLFLTWVSCFTKSH